MMSGTPTTTARHPLVAFETANSCFFRSAAEDGSRKALVQVTERCNLHCAHCFVSATQHGADISLDAMTGTVIPRLLAARVRRITLTGGEPFVHPELVAIVEAARRAGMSVGICTNATCVSDEQIARLIELGDVHINVSFDGFRPDSHGRFRGDVDSFAVTQETTRRLASAGLLQGLLSTPNALTSADDYRLLAEFAAEIGAQYLLMNPLSSFGRGIKSRRRLGAEDQAMREIGETARMSAGAAVEVVPIRFPNEDKPLAGCIAGDIIYVFADGDVAVCPYLAFAARSPVSQHRPEEFMAGNIFNAEVAGALDDYHFHERYTVGANATCGSCVLSADCGKGCPAAVVAAGGRIGDRDVEVCPIP